MKIAIATPYAEPEKGACIIRMNSFREYFEAHGHEVVFFAPARPGIPETKGVSRYKGRTELLRLFMFCKYDVLVGTSPPMTDSFFALLAARLRGKPRILDIRDPWTYAYEGLGIYGRESLKLKAYKTIERLSYRLAQRIFVVTDFTGRIAKREGAKKEKIALVPNGTIPPVFKRDKAQGAFIRKKLKIPKDAVVLLYAGAFIKKDLDAMLENLAPSIGCGKFHVLLVLSAEQSMKQETEKLKEFVKRLGISGKTSFVDSTKFGYGELYKYFSAADIGLNPLPDAMDYCIPAKTYDYLACGLPVLAKGPRESALREVVEGNGAGFYFDSWEALRAAFPEKIPNRKKLGSMGLKCIRLAGQKFDRKNSAKIALKEILGLA